MMDCKRIKGFKSSLTMAVTAAIITAALATISTPASAAVTLNIQNVPNSSDKILLGASGINIGGTLYNVQFVDGSFNSVFGASPLTFTIPGVAISASTALNAQVFQDGPLGQFDTIFTADGNFLTQGCGVSNPLPSGGTFNSTGCQVYTPYFFANTSVVASMAFNRAAPPSPDTDTVSPSSALGSTFDFSTSNQSSQRTWAVWTKASVAAIPEPSTYAMMGLGLLGIMWGSRRRQDVV